jgi:hypothetical protein
MRIDFVIHSLDIEVSCNGDVPGYSELSFEEKVRSYRKSLGSEQEVKIRAGNHMRHLCRRRDVSRTERKLWTMSGAKRIHRSGSDCTTCSILDFDVIERMTFGLQWGGQEENIIDLFRLVPDHRHPDLWLVHNSLQYEKSEKYVNITNMESVLTAPII